MSKLFFFFSFFFFFNDTATTEIYTLSLHDALPIFNAAGRRARSRLPAPHAQLALWLRHVSDECRAVEPAEFHRLAGPLGRRPPHVRHHHGAEPRLHGSRLRGCPPARLEHRADHRNADPFDARRYTCTAWRPCGEPVLPAR